MKRVTSGPLRARATTLMKPPNLALPVLISNGMRFGSPKMPWLRRVHVATSRRFPQARNVRDGLLADISRDAAHVRFAPQETSRSVVGMSALCQ
jgi:hypothetical protein